MNSTTRLSIDLYALKIHVASLALRFVLLLPFLSFHRTTLFDLCISIPSGCKSQVIMMLLNLFSGRTSDLTLRTTAASTEATNLVKCRCSIDGRAGGGSFVSGYGQVEPALDEADDGL